MKYTCKNCGKIFFDYPSNERIYCSKECMKPMLSGLMKKSKFWLKKKNYSISENTKRKIGLKNSKEKHPQWIGGKYKMQGYILKRTGIKKYKLEHRLVMGKHIGRELKSSEMVHHLNGIRNDNRIENLVLCENRKEHQFLHRDMERLVYKLIKKGIVKYNRTAKTFDYLKERE